MKEQSVRSRPDVKEHQMADNWPEAGAHLLSGGKRWSRGWKTTAKPWRTCLPALRQVGFYSLGMKSCLGFLRNEAVAAA